MREDHLELLESINDVCVLLSKSLTDNEIPYDIGVSALTHMTVACFIRGKFDKDELLYFISKAYDQVKKVEEDKGSEKRDDHDDDS